MTAAVWRTLLCELGERAGWIELGGYYKNAGDTVSYAYSGHRIYPARSLRFSLMSPDPRP